MCLKLSISQMTKKYKEEKRAGIWQLEMNLAADIWLLPLALGRGEIAKVITAPPVPSRYLFYLSGEGRYGAWQGMIQM